MGPTNVALVNLYKADQKLREAQGRLEAAQRSVRIQERRVADFSEKSKLSQSNLREQQARAGELDLDLRTKDALIERLRTQQQTANNNKEYQTFLIEINTAKLDRSKIEEEAIKVMESVEKGTVDTSTIETQLTQEKARLQEMKAQIGDTVKELQADVDAQQPARAAAATVVPANVLKEFERLADHHEGEALAAISKPDRRREEYLCMACNMELVRDVYNKLRTRDETIHCPSCRRFLYIPEELSPEAALGTPRPAVKKTRTAAPRATRVKKASPSDAAASPDHAPTPTDEVTIELRAKGRLGEVLTKAQGETVRSANAAGETPVECEVFVTGELAGIYKGQTPEQLARAIKYFMGEAGLVGSVEVRPLVEEEASAPAETADASVSSDQPSQDEANTATATHEPPASA